MPARKSKTRRKPAKTKPRKKPSAKRRPAKAAKRPEAKRRNVAKKPAAKGKAAKKPARRRKPMPGSPVTAVFRKLGPPRKTDKIQKLRKAPRLSAPLPRGDVTERPSRMVLVFLGPPGVGKGTQAAKLAAELKLPHVSTGDLFRDHLKRQTPLGLKAKEFMNSGQLVPDELVIDLVLDRIAQPDSLRGYIMDGFPRTIPQADKLAQALRARGDGVSAVLYFDAPRDVIVERISGRRTCRQCGAISHVTYSPTRTQGICDVCGGETYQRADDETEKVRQRLQVYDASTGPLVPYYRERGLLREFDARGGVDEIYRGVAATVATLR